MEKKIALFKITGHTVSITQQENGKRLYIVKASEHGKTYDKETFEFLPDAIEKFTELIAD